MTGDSIEKTVIRIEADVKRALADLDRAKKAIDGIGDEAEKTGRRTKTAGQQLITAFKSVEIYAAAAAAAIGAIGYKSITAAGNAEEVRNKFQAVFKGTAEDAEQWAEDFSNTVGRSTLETLQYLSTFQDTFVPLGFDREEAANLSEQLVQLSVDLASFNNESDTDTITSLQSALVGNHETMRRYGVIITQTTLDQQLMNMGIDDGIQKATEMEKVQARLNIIMNSTTDAQGDAARTADSFANQMRTLQGSIADVMAEAGKEGMDDLTQTMIKFNEWGENGGYDQMADGIEDMAGAFADLAYWAGEATKFVSSAYAFMTSQQYEPPEGMRMSGYRNGDSETIGVVPKNLNAIFNEKNRPSIEASIVAMSGEDDTDTSGGSSGDGGSGTGQNTSNRAQSSIPDWAGKSDYINSRLGEIGGKSLEDMFASAGIPSNIGGNQIVESMIQSMAKPSVAIPDISVNLADVNRTGFSSVVSDIDRKSVV